MKKSTALSEAIADSVRANRKARRWTQSQLAEMVGLHRQAVVKVESGSYNLRLTTVQRFVDALDIAVELRPTHSEAFDE